MKIAVITPYCGEPNDWLAECHESVKRQTHPTTHILVADGQPIDLVSSFDAQHIILPITHRDYGDTPRALGSLSAARQWAYSDDRRWRFRVCGRAFGVGRVCRGCLGGVWVPAAAGAPAREMSSQAPAAHYRLRILRKENHSLGLGY